MARNETFFVVCVRVYIHICVDDTSLYKFKEKLNEYRDEIVTIGEIYRGDVYVSFKTGSNCSRRSLNYFFPSYDLFISIRKFYRGRKRFYLK